MKYLKLTPEAIDAFSANYYSIDASMTHAEAVFESFVKAYPEHIVESTPTENKEREELLMVAAQLFANSDMNQIDEHDCIAMAQRLIAAVNASCEIKEDKA